jgi:hypothetical protein
MTTPGNASNGNGRKHSHDRAGFLRTLLDDTAGNTLAIVAATIILLVSLVGSGTDMSRAYMTSTSLQNACDAGVLAGRKAMNTSGTYSTAETAKANKMFNFNFNAAVTKATGVTFTTASTAAGEVTGTATATMPTIMMGMFGFTSIPLTVNCSAEVQMASADVMFVLDTTGSMACNTSGSNCVSGSDSKIQGVRDAVSAFYKTVAAAVVDKSRTRIRFGFVPYSMTVNVKDLITSGAMPASYISDTVNYQTKLAYFNTAVYPGTPGTPVVTVETYGSNLNSSNCTNYGKNKYPQGSSGTPVSAGGPPPTATTSTSYTFNSWGGSGNGTGTCKRNKSVTTTTYSATPSGYELTNWRYVKSAVNVSGFKSFGNVSLATSTNTGANVPTAGYYNPQLLAATSGTSGINTASYTWAGCIEERATVNDLAMAPPPSGATDLDLDSAPVDEATKWKPYLESLEFHRGSNLTQLDTTTNATTTYPTTSGSTAMQAGYCPSPAKLFTTVDTTAPTVVPSWLTTYLNGLVAIGGTYHDIGMIWGGRLASPSGIFKSNVVTTDFPSVSRHIIFMTDGEMAPETDYYSAYGTELYDNRVAPSGTTRTGLIDWHNSRFLAACTKAKAMGYTVWVIGFGQAITTQMTSCATANRAYFASNTTDLNNTFKFIAGQVADLRINK